MNPEPTIPYITSGELLQDDKTILPGILLLELLRINVWNSLVVVQLPWFPVFDVRIIEPPLPSIFFVVPTIIFPLEVISISDGEYANLLYELFGHERVEKELEEFLSNDFFPRFGGGIGVTRLLSALTNCGVAK